MARRQGRLAPCIVCHRHLPAFGYQRCRTCWAYWWETGTDRVPSQPRRQGRKPGGGRLADRLEDYTELRSWGLDRRQAAARLGVSYRTVVRYETALREQAANSPAAAAA